MWRSMRRLIIGGINNFLHCHIIRFCEVPVAAVAMLCSYVPEKVDDAPIICYPQHGEGSCGISAFSSAFFYMFDKDLGAKIYSQKKEYIGEFKYSC